MWGSTADLNGQEETPQLFLIQSKQQYLLLSPFLLCRCESTETVNVSDMTVNLRRQSDSSKSKRYNSEGLSHKYVCAHTLHYLWVFSVHL